MFVRALVAHPDDHPFMRLASVPEPTPRANEALITVRHAALNRGDLNDARSGRVPPGAALGSDVAGVVARAAADGGGPAVGARVVALARGAFAERVAVATADLAVVPAGTDLAAAAALPVAGLAALRSLRASWPLLVLRVLVTGAFCGVCYLFV